MNSRSRALAAASLVTVLALSGCGGSDTDPKRPKQEARSTASADPAPASGKKISTIEYSFSAPKGWDEKRDVPGFDFDAAAANPDDKDGFADNMTVIRVEPSPVDTIDDLEDGSRRELEGIGAADIKLLDRQKVDGVDAAHLTSAASQNGRDYLVNQLAILKDRRIYVLTFSFSPDVTAAQQDRLVQSVIASWKWAS